MSPPPRRPLLACLLLGLAAAASASAAAEHPEPDAAEVEQVKANNCAVGIGRRRCLDICKHENSPTRAVCQHCHPGVCGDGPDEPQHSAALSLDDGCVDAHGVRHAAYETWKDDETYTCHLFTCHPPNKVVDVDLGAGCRPEPTDLGECTRHRNVGQCCYNYTCSIPDDRTLLGCDDGGVHRAHGETWPDDPDYPCKTFICNDGVITVIQNTQPLCQQAPDPQCVASREIGHCCFHYNCTIINDLQTCYNTGGAPQEHSVIWFDDQVHPCVQYFCDNGTTRILLDKRDHCEPAPTQHGCRSTRLVGECCYNYTCGCVHNGVLYPDGAHFPDNPLHPCVTLGCAAGTQVTLSQTTCPSLHCSNTEWPIGKCCRVCAPCRYNGADYPNGNTWYDDPTRPCAQFRCDDGHKVLLHNITCDPSPHSSCTPWYMDGVCCPKWDCLELPCVHAGVSHDHGTTWPEDPLKPCRTLACNNSEISVAAEAPDCAGPPEPHCQARDVPYQCCPAYDCVQIICHYNDQVYNENDTWYDDPAFPCKRFSCAKTGTVKIEDRSVDCEPLVPHDCPSQREPGECCKTCIGQDPFCEDDLGGQHAPNETFFQDPETKCVFVRCSGNETEVEYDRRDNCGPDPRLTNPDCVVVAIENCCPLFHCPNCVYDGVEYPPGAKWWVTPDRQCTRHMCMADGTDTIVFTRLPCPEVRPGCVPNYRGTECCHFKYTCMFDPQHNLIPMT